MDFNFNEAQSFLKLYGHQELIINDKYEGTRKTTLLTLQEYLNSELPTGLADVAYSGSYNDLVDTPDLSGYLQSGDNITELVNNAGYLTSADLSNYIQNGDNVSLLTNDAGYLTSVDLTGYLQSGDDISLLNNDSGYITGIDSADVINALGYTPANVLNVPTLLSQLTNDVGYITGINSSDVINALGYTPANTAALAAIAFSGSYSDLIGAPTNVSAFTNDAGYITSIPSTYLQSGDNVSELTNDAGYLVSADLSGYLPLTAGTTKRLSGDLFVSKAKPQIFYEDNTTNTWAKVGIQSDILYITSGSQGAGNTATSGDIRFSGLGGGTDIGEFSVRYGGSFRNILHSGNLSTELTNYVDTTTSQSIGGNKTFNNNLKTLSSFTSNNQIYWGGGHHKLFNNDGGGNSGIRFGWDYDGGNIATETGRPWAIKADNDDANGDFSIVRSLNAITSVGESITQDIVFSIEGSTGVANFNYTPTILGVDIATTNDLSGYVDLTTNQTIGGSKTFSASIVSLGNVQGGKDGDYGELHAYSSTSGYVTKIFTSTAYSYIRRYEGALYSDVLINDNKIDFRNTSGVVKTVAFTDALTNYLPLTAGSSNPISGSLYFNQTDGQILKSNNSGRMFLCGGSTASTANSGAYIYVQGNDYGGVNQGGNIYLNVNGTYGAAYYKGSEIARVSDLAYVVKRGKRLSSDGSVLQDTTSEGGINAFQNSTGSTNFPHQFGNSFHFDATTNDRMFTLWKEKSGNPNFYLQAYNSSGVAQGWNKIVIESDLSDYLPLTGGTLTGDLFIRDSEPCLRLEESDTNTYARFVVSSSDLYIQAGASGAGTSGSGDIRFAGYNNADIGNFNVRYNGLWRDIFHAGNFPLVKGNQFYGSQPTGSGTAANWYRISRYLFSSQYQFVNDTILVHGRNVGEITKVLIDVERGAGTSWSRQNFKVISNSNSNNNYYRLVFNDTTGYVELYIRRAGTDWNAQYFQIESSSTTVANRDIVNGGTTAPSGDYFIEKGTDDFMGYIPQTGGSGYQMKGDMYFRNNVALRMLTTGGASTRTHVINTSNIEYIGSVDQAVNATYIGNQTSEIRLRVNNTNHFTLNNETLSYFNNNSLGTTSGDYKKVYEQYSSGGSNNFYVREWLYRENNGSDWFTVNHINGISIDSSFGTPTTSRTWWKRDPQAGRHMIGDGASEFLRLSNFEFTYKSGQVWHEGNASVIKDTDNQSPTSAGAGTFLSANRYYYLKAQAVTTNGVCNFYLPSSPRDGERVEILLINTNNGTSKFYGNGSNIVNPAGADAATLNVGGTQLHKITFTYFSVVNGLTNRWFMEMADAT